MVEFFVFFVFRSKLFFSGEGQTKFFVRGSKLLIFLGGGQLRNIFWSGSTNLLVGGQHQKKNQMKKNI